MLRSFLRQRSPVDPPQPEFEQPTPEAIDDTPVDREPISSATSHNSIPPTRQSSSAPEDPIIVNARLRLTARESIGNAIEALEGFIETTSLEHSVIAEFLIPVLEDAQDLLNLAPDRVQEARELVRELTRTHRILGRFLGSVRNHWPALVVNVISNGLYDLGDFAADLSKAIVETGLRAKA
jgi:hypothetical protein